jgi:hypothetical protein
MSFEGRSLAALFDALQLPNDDDRREDFNGTIQSEPGKRHGTCPHGSN